MKTVISSFFTFLLIHIVWSKFFQMQKVSCYWDINKNDINIVIFVAKVVIQIVNMTDKSDIWYPASVSSFQGLIFGYDRAQALEKNKCLGNGRT